MLADYCTMSYDGQRARDEQRVLERGSFGAGLSALG